MNDKVVRREGARRDLIAIYRHHAHEAGVRTADRFLKAAEAAFRRLAARPGLGVRFDPEGSPVGEFRHLPLGPRVKSYLVFYRPIDGGIEVVRVLHGARDIPNALAEEFHHEGNGGVDPDLTPSSS